jgi:light-regulated signal transduction histidine kinase (bacteriophytochrome)
MQKKGNAVRYETLHGALKNTMQLVGESCSLLLKMENEEVALDILQEERNFDAVVVSQMLKDAQDLYEHLVEYQDTLIERKRRAS